MKLAVVDIGTRSIKFLLTEVIQSKLHTLVHQRLPAFLGEALVSNQLGLEIALGRDLETIKDFYHIAKNHNIYDFVILGTSALRRIEEANKFAHKIEKLTNTEIEIISGIQEAELLSYIPAYIFRDKRITTFKIGGGSTELASCNFGIVENPISIEVGGISFTHELINMQALQPENDNLGVQLGKNKISKRLVELPESELLLGVGVSSILIDKINKYISNKSSEISPYSTLDINNLRNVRRFSYSHTPQTISEQTGIPIYDTEFISGISTLMLSILETLQFTSFQTFSGDIAHGKTLKMLQKLLPKGTNLIVEPDAYLSPPI